MKLDFSLLNKVFSDSLVQKFRELMKVQLLALAVYLVLSSVLALRWGWWEVGGWILGVSLGWWILDLDHVMDVFWIRALDESSKPAWRLFNERKWRELMLWLMETRGERKKIILHSVVFQVILLGLAIYVTSSGGSLFAKGLVLGFWVRVVLDQSLLFLKEKDLNQWLWQVTGEIPEQVQGLMVASGVILSFWLTVSAF